MLRGSFSCVLVHIYLYPKKNLVLFKVFPAKLFWAVIGRKASKTTYNIANLTFKRLLLSVLYESFHLLHLIIAVKVFVCSHSYSKLFPVSYFFIFGYPLHLLEVGRQTVRSKVVLSFYHRLSLSFVKVHYGLLNVKIIDKTVSGVD